MDGHLVIGTAGHIDHGKTALVRALTGVDTDRLPEEKKRGISIDLGFASLDLGNGRSMSIVDVPGHERFIKNMVAGVAGIDAVLMVVAADEGIMPQTREHLDIVSLLGVRRGVVALTKVDLVWDEWLEEMRSEVRDGLSGTFLEDSPLVEVSAVSGRGMDELRRVLSALPPDAGRRRSDLPARLPVDRVFSVSGFGTVVTGTLAGGRIAAGDRLQVLPPGGEARVRGLEIHGRGADEALAGHRVAVNLSGIPATDLERGYVLAEPGAHLPVRGFGGKLALLEGRERPLASGARVRLHAGTAEVMGRILLLDRERLEPGETAFIHFRSESPLVTAPGDHFIIRRYSPPNTIGGGRVLDIMRRYRRFDAEGIAELGHRERGDHASVAAAVLNRAPARVFARTGLTLRLGLPGDQVEKVTEELVDAGQAFRVGGGVIGAGSLERVEDAARRALDGYHRRHPLRPGMPRAQLRQALFPRIDGRALQALVGLLARRGVLREDGDAVADPLFEPTLATGEEALARRLVAGLEESPFEPPPLDDDAGPDLLHHLEARGDIVLVSSDLAFSASAVERARETIVSHFKGGGEGLTVAAFRDLLGTSRRFALALLNYFDSEGVTRRVGDVRHLRARDGDQNG